VRRVAARAKRHHVRHFDAANMRLFACANVRAYAFAVAMQLSRARAQRMREAAVVGGAAVAESGRCCAGAPAPMRRQAPATQEAWQVERGHVQR